ncbi:TIGR01244 family sulfur transferase [Prosthecomicrobium sp. N25]|uniref:TIGR01244 family sulfur transferase n=1 Tax=Prosthecomicrobium sp. N25 TaxID=3129254 RepID=UPI003076E0D3
MAIEFKRLADDFAVAEQIGVEDVPAIAAAGYRVIVGNRPDREAPAGQPDFVEVARAAGAAGLKAEHIPFRGADVRPDQVRALADLIEAGEGPILAYCRSGTRSTILWAAASAALGRDLGEIVAAAAEAGYDLRPYAEPITLLGRAARG